MLQSNVCRLCAQEGTRCIDVFGADGKKAGLKHKLRVVSPITVKETDKLSTQVCLTCLSALDQSYEFYQTMKLAQIKLKEMQEKAPQRKRLLSSSDDIPVTKKFGSHSSISSSIPNSLSDSGNEIDRSSASTPVTQEPVINLKNEPMSPTKSVNDGSTSVSQAAKHLTSSRLVQPSKTFKNCQHCSNQYLEGMLPRHEVLCRKTLYTCSDCSKSFFHEDAFERHKKKNHEK